MHVRRAVDIRSGRLAPGDTLIADAWDQLALIHRDRRDFRAALDSWNRAIEIRKQAHGQEHPEVARLLAQTGVPWMELGDLDRARLVLEESLAMFARTSGRDDRRRWIPLNILADVSGRRGDLALNVDLTQEALRVVQESFGERSREALTLRGNLAIALMNLGDVAGSHAINTEPPSSPGGAVRPRSPSNAVGSPGLAMSSRSLGDTAVAMQTLRDLEKALMARGEAAPPRGMALVLSLQAEFALRQGRDADARALAERAIRMELAGRHPGGEAVTAAQEIVILSLEATGDTAALAAAARDLSRMSKEYSITSAVFSGSVPLHLARAERALGRREEAWRHALEAESFSREHLRFNLQALPDRRALQLTRREQEPLEMVVDLARDGDRERVETAWDRIVRSRGMLRAEIAHRQSPRGLADTAVTAAHERWMSAQRRLARRLVSGGMRDSAARASLDALRMSSDDAEAAYTRALAHHGARIAPPRSGSKTCVLVCGPAKRSSVASR